MTKLTKKQAATARRAAWRTALAEGRVVAYGDLKMESFASVAAAETEVALNAGNYPNVRIVKVSREEQAATDERNARTKNGWLKD